MRHPAATLVLIAAALLHCAVHSFAAEENTSDGCRLAADDPLRAEVDQLMKQGEAFEQQQKLALEEKVNLLARTRGWTKRDEHEYLIAVMREGVQENWNPTLVLAATFMKICEQSAGNQRVEAVRVFREFYVLEEKQWRSMHQRVDKEIAEVGPLPENQTP